MQTLWFDLSNLHSQAFPRKPSHTEVWPSNLKLNLSLTQCTVREPKQTFPRTYEQPGMRDTRSTTQQPGTDIAVNLVCPRNHLDLPGTGG
jgi:hypothetical protein